MYITLTGKELMMHELIREALRGLEHALHLGDMVVSEVAGIERGPHDTTRLTRGLFIGGIDDDTILLRLRDRDIKAKRSKRPIIIPDEDLKSSELEWVPLMRLHIQQASRTSFEVPGLGSLTEDLVASLDGTLQCIEAPDSTPRRKRWVVFHNRQPVGVYTRGSFMDDATKTRTYVDLRPTREAAPEPIPAL
jgi:hypothetical protein